MAEEGTQRRLAAIVATDMVGYSRLMQADEVGTIARQKAHRSELIDPTIARFGGRIVKSTGDGLLIEFPSVVDAVRCCTDIQRAMAQREAAVPEERRIRYRVGINLGDIILDGDDILGDGVNVAARLEALASPGGICVSRTVRNQVRDKLEIAFEDLGEVEVKNIARPIRVFRVLGEGEAAPAPARPKPRPRMIAGTAAAVVLLVLAGVGVWWWQSRPDFAPADPAKMAFELPDKPSIAVLPFDNLSGDPEQDYLGDGLTENIIAVLSTSPDLFVIARNSSFTYKGKPVQVQEVAERFGVRYVLEGSVQQSGERLRVTAQLVDAIDGRHLWAERYDRELTDLFAFQDEITQQIAVAMSVKLTRGESALQDWQAAGDLETFRQFELVRRRFQTFSVEGHLETEQLLTELLVRKPDSSYVHRWMGWIHWQKVTLGLSDDVGRSIATARRFAERATALNERSSMAHILLATLDSYSMKHDSAVAHAERALEIAPSNPSLFALAGWVKIAAGQAAEGVELMKRGMRAEPDYPHWIPTATAYGLMMLGHYEESKAINKGVLASKVEDARAHRFALQNLATVAIWEGDEPLARRYIQRLIDTQPDANLAATRRELYHLKDQEFVQRFYDALRRAGLPEG